MVKSPRKRYPRRYLCEDCGVPTERKRSYSKSAVCLDCGIIRSVAASYAMVQRVGPAWEAHQRNPGGRPRRSPPSTD